MATKSILTETEIETALTSQLRKPARVPSGDESRIVDFHPELFSDWLQTLLHAKLEAHPDWISSGPIALGSWSRNELAPKSDIDLLFVGDEAAVRRLTTDFSKQGLKLRYRMPEDREDWTVGVEPFDVLALISAKALVPEVAQDLAVQQTALRKSWSDVRSRIAQAMVEERRARAERFDSISNYLEPNLKYGPGGLRDLEQALAMKLLFPERFENRDPHPFAVLSYYKKFFLLVRQRLHLSEGATDLLAAPEQEAIARWLGYDSSKPFMKEIQKGVSRVSFYADWVFEQALATKARLKKVESVRLEKPQDLFEALEFDSSVLMQNRVRLRIDDVFEHHPRDPKLTRMLGRKLTQFLDSAAKEAPMVALFRSRLIDHCVPEFRRIVGHVQHDQYHRFSVDAHILQALRELSRLRKSLGRAGKLQPLLKSLSEKDWEILSFACLYHDIAKGRQGDHSIEGIGITREDLTAFGKNEAFVREVTWVVERHLALSAAAFRENPASPQTWSSLSGKGVSGRRIPILAAFTFVDIRATNPDAWTPWKERLLAELVGNLEKPEASSAIAFADELKARKLDSGWVEKIDPFLVTMVSPKKLVDDLEAYLHASKVELAGEVTGDLAPLVLRTRAGQTWIRFHSKDDKPGLFVRYVAALSRAGFGIRHASIHTFEDAGVYDWFEVKTQKTPKQIEKLLALALETNAKTERANSSNAALGTAKAAKPIKFDHVTLVSSGTYEWIISFRGKDQQGALLQAANALLAETLEIRWARVHTWGRQIDDVFGVKPSARVTAASLVERLNRTFA